MGIFTNIEAALNTRLATLSGSPSIAWPNVDYIPVEGTSYIQPTLLPTSVDLECLSGAEIHKGIYQIDVYVPMNKGISALNTLLDNIESLYSSNKTLTAASNNVFIQSVGRGRSRRQESWYNSFIEVNYLCYS